MPATELCVIHPGGLSASAGRASPRTCPPARRVQVLELETINALLGAGPGADGRRARRPAARSRSARALDRGARRLGRRRRRRRRAGRALAAPARASSCSTAPAPGAPHGEPGEARPAALVRDVHRRAPRAAGCVDPERCTTGSSRRSRELRGGRASAPCAPTPRPPTVAALLDEHARARAARPPPDRRPRAVRHAADRGQGRRAACVPDSPALGWERFGPVERLASGGDHYSMLTDPAAAAHLAMLLRRWLAPAFAAVA